ncbi:MAG: ATP synthase subunit I [Candidatus Eiseniibacteriota bacterium]
MTDIVLFGALGLGLGAVYFGGLYWNVRLFISGGGLWPVALIGLRFALAGVVFWLAARHGAPALLAAFAGFLVMRVVLLQLARRHV